MTKAFSSGVIAPGATWKFLAHKAGVLPYLCTLHPNMHGKLIFNETHRGSPVCSLPFPALSPEHIHPILVNFTAALVPASVGSDIAGRVFRRANAAQCSVVDASICGSYHSLTACAGWWWKQRVSDALPAELLLRHQRL